MEATASSPTSIQQAAGDCGGDASEERQGALPTRHSPARGRQVAGLGARQLLPHLDDVDPVGQHHTWEKQRRQRVVGEVGGQATNTQVWRLDQTV